MRQLDELDRTHDGVWERAADQASADMRRAQSHDRARASYFKELTDLQRRRGTVTIEEAQALWSAAKAAAASTA
jgi:hypothetical protein